MKYQKIAIWRVFQLKTNRFSHGTSPYPPTVPTLGPPILFLRMSLPAPVAAAPNRFSLPWGAIRSFPSEQRRPPHYLALALPLPTDLWPLDPCPPAAAPVTRPHPFASPDPPEWGIGAIGAGAGAATTTMTAAVGGGGGGGGGIRPPMIKKKPGGGRPPVRPTVSTSRRGGARPAAGSRRTRRWGTTYGVATDLQILVDGCISTKVINFPSIIEWAIVAIFFWVALILNDFVAILWLFAFFLIPPNISSLSAAMASTAATGPS
jgi:hypothetical protein